MKVTRRVKKEKYGSETVLSITISADVKAYRESVLLGRIASAIEGGFDVMTVDRHSTQVTVRKRYGGS